MTKFDSYRKKTFTNYWNHFSTSPKKFQISSIMIRKIKNILRKFFPFTIKIKTHKKSDNFYEMFSSYQIDKDIIFHRNLLLSKAVFEFLRNYNLKFTQKEVRNYVLEYCNVFSKTPVKDMNSGFGFNEGLFLFCIIKVIKPSLVIESGVMKGFTTYLIDAATKKDCIIYCYDISFENIEYKSQKGNYINNDIKQSPPDLRNHKVLAFWDDHTSQLDRLEFSIKNRIIYNIFDDDLGFLNFHSDGWPPIPSITMLLEIQKNLIKTNKIEWFSRGRKGEIFIKKFINNKSTKYISVHKKFLNLFSLTGYKSNSDCSFVTLKKNMFSEY